MNNNDSILIIRADSEEDVSVEFRGSTFNDVAEVFNERWSSRGTKVAARSIGGSGKSEVGTREMDTHYIRLPAKTTGTGYAFAT